MAINLDPYSLALGMVLIPAARLVISRLLDARQMRAQRMTAAEARAVLQRHGITQALYMPAFGIDDPELRQALDVLAGGTIAVTMREGRIIGAIGTPERKLRLVVDNTKR